MKLKWLGASLLIAGMAHVLVTVSIPSLLRAAEPPVHPPIPYALAHVRWIKLKGKVEAADLATKSLKIVDDDNSLITVTVDEHVQILRSYVEVELDKLKTGDQVELHYSSNPIMEPVSGRILQINRNEEIVLFATDKSGEILELPMNDTVMITNEGRQMSWKELKKGEKVTIGQKNKS